MNISLQKRQATAFVRNKDPFTGNRDQKSKYVLVKGFEEDVLYRIVPLIGVG